MLNTIKLERVSELVYLFRLRSMIQFYMVEEGETEEFKYLKEHLFYEGQHCGLMKSFSLLSEDGFDLFLTNVQSTKQELCSWQKLMQEIIQQEAIQTDSENSIQSRKVPVFFRSKPPCFVSWYCDDYNNENKEENTCWERVCFSKNDWTFYEIKEFIIGIMSGMDKGVEVVKNVLKLSAFDLLKFKYQDSITDQVIFEFLLSKKRNNCSHAAIHYAVGMNFLGKNNFIYGTTHFREAIRAASNCRKGFRGMMEWLTEEQCSNWYISRALEAKTQLNYGDAIENFTHAILVNRFNRKLYIFRGELYQLTGDTYRAEIDFSNATYAESETNYNKIVDPTIIKR